jgi:hypothetical protein
VTAPEIEMALAHYLILTRKLILGNIRQNWMTDRDFRIRRLVGKAKGTPERIDMVTTDIVYLVTILVPGGDRHHLS